MFIGEYRHTVDDKGRVAVPIRFRAQLAGTAFVSRWIDGCLAIFPPDGFERLAEKAATLPVADPGARFFNRYVFTSAFEFELDRQGRAVVPAHLREWAGLTTEAVVVGAHDHVELWAPDRWDAYGVSSSDSETIAGHLQGLGI